MKYFVDKRIGCIAVRERALVDPDYNGLHPDTQDVVKYWPGHFSEGIWSISDEDIKEAEKLCKELNKQ